MEMRKKRFRHSETSLYKEANSRLSDVGGRSDSVKRFRDAIFTQPSDRAKEVYDSTLHLTLN